MFIYVGNTFMGSKSTQKKGCCTLKFWGSAILELCKLTTFPGSDFDKLCFVGSGTTQIDICNQKCFCVNLLGVGPFFSYIYPTKWEKMESHIEFVSMWNVYVCMYGTRFRPMWRLNRPINRSSVNCLRVHSRLFISANFRMAIVRLNVRPHFYRCQGHKSCQAIVRALPGGSNINIGTGPIRVCVWVQTQTYSRIRQKTCIHRGKFCRSCTTYVLSPLYTRQFLWRRLYRCSKFVVAFIAATATRRYTQSNSAQATQLPQKRRKPLYSMYVSFTL